MVDSVRRLAPIALCLALAAPPAQAAPSPSFVTPFDGDPVRELLASLNDARREAGLVPLVAEPALAKVATRRVTDVATTGELDADADVIMGLSRDLRRAGYPPYAWRQRLVQGPRDAGSLVRQWKDSDPAGFAEVVLGDFEGFGAALAPGVEPPLWSLFVRYPGSPGSAARRRRSTTSRRCAPACSPR